MSTEILCFIHQLGVHELKSVSGDNLNNLKTIGYIEFDSLYEAKKFERQVKKYVAQNNLYRRVHKKLKAGGQTEVISKLKLSKIIDLDMFGFAWLMKVVKEVSNA